jgi:hypothetical protein
LAISLGNFLLLVDVTERVTCKRLQRQRDSILLAASSLIRICQKEKITAKIASVNQMRQSCTENLNAFRGVFKMSDNENISMAMRGVNNNSILNERQVHQKQ